MKILKKILAVAIILTMIASIFVMSTISSSASGTGTGLAEWCLKAYNNKWSYVYGGCTPGTVDCSGLIYSYAGGIRTGDAQLYNSDYIGYVSNGVPRIHGLGLWKPGHVGVYVGNGMAVDARGSQWGVCYESVYTHGWTKYFKVPGVSYPSTGWVTFNGSKYYYENGQYVASTSRTLDGVTYNFDSSGKCTNGGGSSSSSSSSSSVSSSSSSSTSTSSSSLKRGSTGTAVEKLQKRLLELGYYNGVVDGDFGKGTEDALKLYQEQAGLYVDGIAGSASKAIYEDDAPKYKAPQTNVKEDTEIAQTGTTNEESDDSSVSNELSYDDTVKMQERLKELGYYTGVVDGDFGKGSEEALRAFQNANGITETGSGDEFTLSVLHSIDAKENPNKVEETAEETTDETANEDTQTIKVVESELPQSVVTANNAEADVTEVELETSKMSEKALADIANDMSIATGANENNFHFIFWLGIMIVVMTIAFFIVQAVEKKKAGKKASAKYF